MSADDAPLKAAARPRRKDTTSPAAALRDLVEYRHNGELRRGFIIGTTIMARPMRFNILDGDTFQKDIEETAIVRVIAPDVWGRGAGDDPN